MLVKPSVGKYVISFAIIPSPTWDGSGLFLGDSVDHQHPREGQGLIPSGWFCVHSKIILMAYPCNVTPWQSQGQHLDPGFHIKTTQPNPYDPWVQASARTASPGWGDSEAFC